MTTKDKDAALDVMVERFLQLPMPKSFNPDGGISFRREVNGRHLEFLDPFWPTGTNLMSSEQAREMFDILLRGFEVTLIRPKAPPVPGFATDLDAVLGNSRELLLDKNRKYGDSALNPKRVFSKASPEEQINVRLDDKLSRLMSGQLDDIEDVVAELDLLGYIILKRILKMREGK